VNKSRKQTLCEKRIRLVEVQFSTSFSIYGLLKRFIFTSSKFCHELPIKYPNIMEHTPLRFQTILFYLTQRHIAVRSRCCYCIKQNIATPSFYYKEKVHAVCVYCFMHHINNFKKCKKKYPSCVPGVDGKIHPS